MSDFQRWFIAAAAFSLSAGVTQAQVPYLISTYAGGLVAPTAAPAVNFAFEFPNAVATDAFGNTYISSGYHCVFRLDKSGNLSRVAGTCQMGFSGDGASAVKAQLNNPQGLAVDSLGNLYIADQGNQRIRMVTPEGIISTVAGTGTAGYSGDNNPAISAKLNNPDGVVVDTAGNLYIADTSNLVIRKVAPNGTISTFAGTGASGSSGDSGPATAATFTSPTGLALDSTGNLYIADATVGEVRMVNPQGTISRVAGTGTQGYNGDSKPAISAELYSPQGLAVDLAGNLYIADKLNFRVRVVSPGGGISTYAGDGIPGDSGDGHPATGAELEYPAGVAADSSGNLFICDLIGVIRLVNASGTISSVAGNPNSPLPFSGDGGPAALATMATPWGLALDGSGNLYAADWKGNRVRKIDAATRTISTFAGNGLAPDSGDGGQAASASVTAPFAVVTDTVAGNFYLAEPGRIRKIDSSGVISTIAGNGTFGNSPDGTLAVNAVIGNYLPGLAVDSQHNVYFADWNNQRVRKIIAATGVLSTAAGNGTAGYKGDGQPATSAEVNYPAGLAVDGSGNLYIADNINCVVRMVAVATGNISTVAGNGTCSNSGNSGGATATEISNPWGVAVDGQGNLYISTQGNTVQKVSGGSIATVAGSGVAGYAGDGGPAIAAQFDSPYGMVADKNGNLYVGDFGNGAIRVLQPETEPLLTVSSTHAGTFPLGQSGTFQITVSNAPQAASSNGTVTVTAALSGGLTAISMDGTGWSCDTLNLPYTCTNSGTLAGNTSFDPISLTVSVPNGALPQVTNQVMVSGGGTLGAGSEDAAYIGSATAALQISATHYRDFIAGGQGKFTITVGNQISAANTSSTVTVSDTLPAAFTLVSLTGTGWDCTGTTCTNSTPLAGGSNYSPIVGAVTVSSSASSPQTNTAAVSGGGGSVGPASNDTIVVLPFCVDVSTVQVVVDQALGISAASGSVNVVNVQNEVLMALAANCSQ